MILRKGLYLKGVRMIFEIARQDFSELIQKTQSIVEKRAAYPLLQNVKIEAQGDWVTVFATDMETGLWDRSNASIQEAGSITVSARKLFEVLKELGDDIVRFEVIENNWIRVTCGSALFKLVGISDADFPEMMTIDTESLTEVDSELLEYLANKSVYAASTDPNKHIYRGVLMKVNDGLVHMVATDGHRLAKVTIENETSLPDMEILIPRKGVMELQRMISSGAEKISIGIEQNHIVFGLNNQITIVRLIDAQFPDFEKVIPRQNTHNIRFDKSRFYDICRRVALFSDIKTHTILMVLNDGVLEVKGSTPEYGEARDEIAIEYEAEPLKLNFNVTYIIEMLRVFECQEIFMRLNEGGPVIFEPAEKDKVDYLALIMPMIM
jgi:DNA polymerase III subunit beta